MKKLKVLRNAIVTYSKIIWNVPVEYDGNKYVLVINEDDDSAEEYLYHYDEDRRYHIGDEYDGDDYDELHEKIFEIMGEAGIKHSCVEEGEEAEYED